MNKTALRHLKAAYDRRVVFSTPVSAKDDFPKYHFDQQIPRSVAERYSKNLKEINDS